MIMKFANLLLLISHFSVIFGDSIQSNLHDESKRNTKKDEVTDTVFKSSENNTLNDDIKDNISNSDNRITLKEKEIISKSENVTLSNLDIQNSEDTKIDDGEIREFCLYSNGRVTKVINPSYTNSNNNTVYFNSIEEYSKYIGPTWFGVGYCGNETIVNNVGIYYKIQLNDKHDEPKDHDADADADADADKNVKDKRDSKNKNQNIIAPEDKVDNNKVPTHDEFKEKFKQLYDEAIKDGLKCIPLSSINPGYNPYHPALINIDLFDGDDPHNVVSVMGLPYGGNGNNVINQNDIEDDTGDQKIVQDCGIVSKLGGSTITCSVKISESITKSLTISEGNTISYRETYGMVESKGNSQTDDINKLIQLSTALSNSQSISYNRNKGESTAIENVLNIIATESTSSSKNTEKVHTENHENSYSHTESESHAHGTSKTNTEVDSYNWSKSQEISHIEEYSRMDRNDYIQTKDIINNVRRDFTYIKGMEVMSGHKEKRLLPLIAAGFTVASAISDVINGAESNQHQERANELAVAANDIATKSNEIALEANFYAAEANNITEEANKIAWQNVETAKQANIIAGEANDLTREANEAAWTSANASIAANKIAKEGNDIAREANNIAGVSNDIAREANSIAREANRIAKWSTEQTVNESIKTRELNERLAKESNERQLRMALAGTRSTSTTKSDITSESEGKSESKSWSTNYEKTSGTSNTWSEDKGYSDSYVMGHSETSNKEYSQSDSLSKMLTNDFSETNGWVNGTTFSETSSNSYSYGQSDTRTYNNDMSLENAIEQSATHSEATSKEITESLDRSKDITFNIPDDRCYNLTALPMFKSEINIWACGEYDANGELYITYKKSIRPIKITEYANTPVECNSKNNEVVINNDRENYVVVDDKTKNKNTLRSRTYLSAGSFLRSQNGRFSFGLLQTGELVLCEGTDINTSENCKKKPLWTNGMKLPEKRRDGKTLSPSNYELKLRLGSNGHLYVTAKHIFNSYNPNVQTPVFPDDFDPENIKKKRNLSLNNSKNKINSRSSTFNTNNDMKYIEDESERLQRRKSPGKSNNNVYPFDDIKDEYVIWDSLPKDLPFNVGFPDGLGYYLFLKEEEDGGASVCIYDGVGIKIWEIKSGIDYKGYPYPREYNMPLAFDTPRAEGVNSLYDIHNTLNLRKVKTKYTHSVEMNCSNFMNQNEALISNNGIYRFYVQPTGNMVIKEGSRTMWSSDTANISLFEGPYKLLFSPLGEFILRDNNSFTLWHVINPISAFNENYINENHKFNLVLSDEGELYIEDENHLQYWSSWPVRPNNTHIRYVKPIIYEISSCGEKLRSKYVYNLFTSPEIYNTYDTKDDEKSYIDKHYVNNILPGESMISAFGAVLNVTESDVRFYYNINEKHEKTSILVSKCQSNTKVKELLIDEDNFRLVCIDSNKNEYNNIIMVFDKNENENPKYYRLSMEYRVPMERPDLMIFDVITWKPIWGLEPVRHLQYMEEVNEPKVDQNKRIIVDSTFNVFDKMDSLDGSNEFLYFSNKNGLELELGNIQIRKMTLNNHNFYIDDELIIKGNENTNMRLEYVKNNNIIYNNSNNGEQEEFKDYYLSMTNNTKKIWELYGVRGCIDIISSNQNCNTLYSNNIIFTGRTDEYFVRKNKLFYPSDKNSTNLMFYDITYDTKFKDPVYSVSLTENGDISINNDQLFLHKEFFKPEPPYILKPLNENLVLTSSTGEIKWAINKNINGRPYHANLINPGESFIENEMIYCESYSMIIQNGKLYYRDHVKQTMEEINIGARNRYLKEIVLNTDSLLFLDKDEVPIFTLQKDKNSNNGGGSVLRCELSAKGIVWEVEGNIKWSYPSGITINPTNTKSINTRPVIGNCDNTDTSKWEIPINGEGFYKSRLNDLCIHINNVDKGTVVMKECDNSSVMYDINDSNNIISILDSGKCLGLFSSNKGNSENRVNLNKCDDNKNDQYWEIKT
ncbi:hypothetical protein BCR32DRAFT_309086 [Anaeromyces robustus]|uniref:Bulb-type lectin domain-containing protein n=1 Tax=Anaeromyces robustus TaxID=1754192 RepID=A0A1Y1XAB6_9FUNG|nr:hypothetical protein BCR32DRAFT_309086 [Anaeromyces robustus]|eukprot:ORX82692.1 hypothetical protein BCR32DRAFT_309086 [Anaeromyces robustus]